MPFEIIDPATGVALPVALLLHIVLSIFAVRRVRDVHEPLPSVLTVTAMGTAYFPLLIYLAGLAMLASFALNDNVIADGPALLWMASLPAFIVLSASSAIVAAPLLVIVQFVPPGGPVRMLPLTGLIAAACMSYWLLRTIPLTPV